MRLFEYLSAVRDPDIARTLLDQREAVLLCIPRYTLTVQFSSAVCAYRAVHAACGMIRLADEAQGKTLLLITNSGFNYTGEQAGLVA